MINIHHRRVRDYICFSMYLIVSYFDNDSHSLLCLALAFFFVEVVGIIKRKALIKDLAAVYHAECLAYCQELLELQRKWEEVRWKILISFLALFD